MTSKVKHVQLTLYSLVDVIRFRNTSMTNLRPIYGKEELSSVKSLNSTKEQVNIFIFSDHFVLEMIHTNEFYIQLFPNKTTYFHNYLIKKE